MSDIHKSLRLGDLLVEKGLITRPQLRQAIEIQQTLQSQRFGGKNINAKTELGEILIELGFISRHQLQSNLNWQRRLKATTAVMVFIAPLLTAACGGGGGGGGGGSSNTATNTKTEVVNSQAPSQASPAPQPTSSNSSLAQAVSTSSSSPKAVSSSSVRSSLSSSSQISSAASSSSSSLVNGSVQLYWTVPTQRENGDYLDITEIGGYELRYKQKSENTFKTIHIADAFTDAYYFDYLKGDYEFQIATFDTEGRYSNFISVDPSS